MPWLICRAAVASICLALGVPQTAHAQFKVCNQGIGLYNIAIGAERNAKFSTEGWWSVPSNSCVTPIKEDLASLKLKYLYVYATSIAGEPAFEGEWDMCVDSKRFKIDRIPNEPWNCWVRGFQQVKFKEIDTGDSTSWTLFIQEGGQ
jgi:uncharacterized membrane protein